MELETTDRIDSKVKQGVVPTYAWVILAVTMLAGICGPFNQFKVPPVMPVLMEVFSINLTSAGMLMSIFAITGLIVALPAGLVLQRFGLKTCGLVAAGCLIIGSVLGAVSNSYEVLFASRLVEGVGMGLIAVVGPAAISAWFPVKRRGLPMGVWATWVSLGSLLVYAIAPRVESVAGWKSVWWISTGLTGIAILLYAIFFHLPPDENHSTKKPLPFNRQGFGKVFNRPGIWLLGLAFGCFNYAIIGVIATYYPTYLKTIHGFDLTGASLITSIKMIVVIITAPLVGWLVDKVGSPRRIILWSFIALAGFMALPFTISGWMIPASMVLLGILAGAIPTCTFTSISELAGKDVPAGIGMGVVLVGQNLGQLLGPVIFGGLVQSLGWTAAGLCTIPVLLAGFWAVTRTTMK
jgi:predicted MFS family arabinose efflux permease